MQRPKILRRPPPHRTKGVKDQYKDQSFSVALGVPLDTGSTQPAQSTRKSRLIPTLVAQDGHSGDHTLWAAALREQSPDMDLSQPPEPVETFPDFLWSLTHDPARSEPLPLPPEATIEEVLGNIEVR